MTRLATSSVLALALSGCFTEPMLEPGPGAETQDSTDSTASTGGEATKGDTQSGGTDGATSDGGSEGSDTWSETDGTSVGPSTSAGPSTSGGSTTDDSDSAESTTTGDPTGEETGSGETTGLAPLTVAELLPGDLIVTEVMWNPSCNFDNCEWIEIFNPLDQPIDLMGLRVDDASASGQPGLITQNVILEPGAFAVLALSSDGWPYADPPDAIYGNAHLNNADFEQVVLLGEGLVIDETALMFTGDIEQGRSTALANDSFDHETNDNEAAWCASTTELDAGPNTEWGTPWAPNDC